MTKSLFFLPTPSGDLSALYYGPQDMGAGAFPLVIFAHGFGPRTSMVESARLFPQAMATLAEKGVGALAFDFYGHGFSDGAYTDMTPQTRVRDLSAVVEWVKAKHKGPLFLLGLSMGGAVAVYAAAKYQQDLKGLVTWSCVPSFDPANPASTWFTNETDQNSVFGVRPDFIQHRPDQDVGAVYQTLSLPKLQVQGDADYPHFQSEFEKFFASAPAPKEHVVIAGADHTFTQKIHRTQAIEKTLAWVLANSR